MEVNRGLVDPLFSREGAKTRREDARRWLGSRSTSLSSRPSRLRVRWFCLSGNGRPPWFTSARIARKTDGTSCQDALLNKSYRYGTVSLLLFGCLTLHISTLTASVLPPSVS